MKVLILMPCDEQHAPAAMALYNNLPEEHRRNTFMIPAFMDYLITTKTVGNWISAFYYSLLAAENIYKTAATIDNSEVIIIGNISKKYSFDAIFSLQDIDETLPYEDRFLEKIKEIVVDEETLANKIKDFYTAEEVKFKLTNPRASADFITSYIKTDTTKELEELEKVYRKKLKEKGVNLDELSNRK